MPENLYQEKIIVLDFGSQYSQLIARRIRESRVYCQILPFSISAEELKGMEPKGIILSGGPFSVYTQGAPLGDKRIFDLGIPLLGICYGMQVMSHLLGGEVAQVEKREYGRTELVITDSSDLFQGLGERLNVWMSHGDSVLSLPSNFEVIGYTKNSPIAAMRNRDKRIYGVQFHPEVVHTSQGGEIIKNFLYRICNCSPTWTMEAFMEHSLLKIREVVGDKMVLCALSGGVDSSAAALLVHRAIGDQLHCIFVNNGLLRLGEAETILHTFREHFHLNLEYINVEERFLKKLKGVINPERKRRIIGNEFIRVFEEESRKLGRIDFLVQGTLYPDVIESTSIRGPSMIIKTHHNVGGLPRRMGFKLIEPFRELFKDEVREIGTKLGLPEEILWRHPFPGPGLAIRILGEVTKDRLETLRRADKIVLEEIEKAGLYKEIWQSFAILLPIRTVGVMGDERTYENVIALRAVTSLDGMTADWAKLPGDLLNRISTRIINEVKGVNRVVYDISSKPPSTIEWE